MNTKNNNTHKVEGNAQETETLTARKTRQIINYIETREDLFLNESTKKVLRLLVAETVREARQEGTNSTLKVLKERGFNLSEVMK